MSTSQILLPTVYPWLAAGLSAAQTCPRNNVCLCPEFLPNGEPQGTGASRFRLLPFVFISYLALGQCFLLFLVRFGFCGVLFCFRLGLIVEASNHSAETVLAASFLARDFMGAQGKNGSRSFMGSSADQARRAPPALLPRCSVPQDLDSSSAFALETINYLPVTTPIDRAGMSASSPPAPTPSTIQLRERNGSAGGFLFPVRVLSLQERSSFPLCQSFPVFTDQVCILLFLCSSKLGDC